jgi:hypothetical protein
MQVMFCFWRDSPPVGQGLLIHEVSKSHTTTRHSHYNSSGRVISSSHRPLPDNTQHSQQTDDHATGAIRTYILSRRATADQRLRPRGHWDRHASKVATRNYAFHPGVLLFVLITCFKKLLESSLMQHFESKMTKQDLTMNKVLKLSFLKTLNLALTGIRSPDRPARSQSLYQLSYPAHVT